MIKTYKFNRCGLVYIVIDKRGNVATSPVSHEEAAKHLKKRTSDKSEKISESN